MKEIMQQMLEQKKSQLKKMQESYMIDTKNINSFTYEDNAINKLLEMKKLKVEIAELEFCLQLK